MKSLLLLLHPAMGLVMMGMLLWILAQLHTETISYRMLKHLSMMIALLGLGVWIVAGYWYVVYYPAEKAYVLHGGMRWAHTIFMETKEHLFLAAAILALYLPIAVTSEESNGHLDAKGKKLIQNIALLLLSLLLFVEAAGAIVTQGAKYGATATQGIERGVHHETRL